MKRASEPASRAKRRQMAMFIFRGNTRVPREAPLFRFVGRGRDDRLYDPPSGLQRLCRNRNDT